MPGKVKVKVLAGRNLPVMDRSNDTTDAYVEVKLGNATCKTDVCRKSLNPEWNSEWFRFEMDDLELQDEPLQIRLMDYDTYSANDSIGRVYIDLNPLLTNPSKTKEPSGRTMSGWIPVYDTMHGIRGEVNLTVKVELFCDLNKFRQSSCGVKFYFTQGIPEGNIAVQLHGFVEELVVNDDPEYQWIDKIRTPRASNEARQTLFSKLSGEVQRRVGLKALELGGNAVIGYRQCFDLEGESGIVVRGIGTAATLTKFHDPQISPMPTDSKECQSKDRRLAAVSIPKPCSHPSSLNQKPSSPHLLSKKPSPSHSSMPESVLRSLCIPDNPNPNSGAFHVPLPCVIPTFIPVSVKHEPYSSTSAATVTTVPTSSSPLTVKDIKSGIDSPVPFITSPVESDSIDQPLEMTVIKVESCLTVEEQEIPSSSAVAAARAEFSGLVLKVSESFKKGLTFGSHNDKTLQANKRRMGSKKKDKYSTSSLVKRVNPDRPTSFIHNTADEVMRFFSKKRRSQHSPEDDQDLDDIERDPSPGYSRTYREPKFKRDFIFFGRKKRRNSCGSSRRSNLRRSLSDSLSLDRNSLESLPSIQSEDLEYKPDWIQIPTSMRMNSIKSPPTRPKVFDPKTVIPESSQPSLSISSNSSEQAGMSNNMMSRSGNNSSTTNNDILEVIRELGFSHTVEKPLKLYISSLDALLVYEPLTVAKNQIENDQHRGRARHSSSSAVECRNFSEYDPVTSHPHACSLTTSITSNQSNNLSDRESSQKLIGLSSSRSLNRDCREMMMTNLNDCGGTPSAATSIITTTTQTHNTKHANIITTNSIASEINETPHIISCTTPPLNSPISGIGNPCGVAVLGESTATPATGQTQSASASSNWIPESIPEDPPKNSEDGQSLEGNGAGSQTRGREPNEYGHANGSSGAAVVLGSGKVAYSSGNNMMTGPSPGSSFSHMPTPATRSQMMESSNNRISLISSNTTKISARTAPTTTAAFGGRRSSESDLSTPPKGLLNSSIQAMLTSSHGKGTSYAQSRGRAPYIDHFDMLEYPFITISTLPPRFLQRIGGSVCARSVKLLERISNLEEPESRDSWWTELRMEIRSHARSICCNVILGYEEHTTICDDVCILSATGTAAIVNSAVLGDMNSVDATGTNKPLAPVPEVRAGKCSKEKPGKVPPVKVPENTAAQQNGAKPNAKTIPFEDCELNCSLTHTPYEDFSLPFPVQMSRCGICKKGRVPDLLLATVELPPNIPICGKICLIQAQICRPKKDGKGEAIANEVSDSLPFLEYELHRRLINKLKVRGMNAIFCMRVQICLGEKMMVGVATGTAVCLAGLRPPDLPKIIAGNTKTDTQKVVQFQNVVKDTFERNKAFYMIDSGPFAKLHNAMSTESQDAEEESEEDVLPVLNLATGNKDTYILEVDDTEDIEIISELIDPCSPTGCEMNTMDTVLEYDDAVIVSQQMFTQVWRCRLPNLTLRQLSNQFDRILRAVAFKLRNVKPCVVNKLRFHLELPDSDEMQLSITGTAFGLTKKPSTVSQPSPIPSCSMKEKRGSVEVPEMIFNLECAGTGNSNGTDLPGLSNLPDPNPMPIISTNVISPSSPGTSTISNTEVHPVSTDALNENIVSPGMDLSKASNERGSITSTTSSSSIPIPTVTDATNLNSNPIDPSPTLIPTATSTTSSSASPLLQFKVSPQNVVSMTPMPPVVNNMPGAVPPLSKTVFKSPSSSKGSYVIEMTTLSHIPGYRIEKYLGNLNFFFIRETTSIKEMGGPTGFLHNLIVEVMTVLRAHVAALGGNALVSYFLNELSLLHNPHKNQGQCLINIGGDAVLVIRDNLEEIAEPPRISI